MTTADTECYLWFEIEMILARGPWGVWEGAIDVANIRSPFAQPGFQSAHSGGAAIKVILALVFISGAVLAILLAAIPLPEPNIPQAVQAFMAEGNADPSSVTENGIVVAYDEIPDSLKMAVVAVEDKRFYNHRGIELSSIGRAFMANLKAGEIVEGGSTITQQLAKNLFLTQDRVLKRKIIEAVYAMKLEMRYSKDEILEMYLNVIYFGHGTYGCEMASRLYFGKPVSDLTLAESAMMAGIIKGPEIYSPYHDLELAEQRKILVLDLLVEQGRIDVRTAEQAKKIRIELAGRPVTTLGFGVPDSRCYSESTRYWADFLTFDRPLDLISLEPG